MNLQKVSSLLSEKNREYEVSHTRVLRSLNLDKETTTLRSYLTLVGNDPEEWLRVTPVLHTKPKTALLFLLEKCDAVREEIGFEECDEIAKRVRATWKNLRKEHQEQVKDEAADAETESVFIGEDLDQTTKLMQEICILRKNTLLLHDIIVALTEDKKCEDVVEKLDDDHAFMRHQLCVERRRLNNVVSRVLQDTKIMCINSDTAAHL
jgi:hypothetical protein